MNAKAIKTLLAASALATVAGAANATVWNLEMSASVFFPAANGPLNAIGFTGTWDDVTGNGTWTGTTTIPGFNTTMHYTQTFNMPAGGDYPGWGFLNPLETATCTDNTGSACTGLGGALTGDFMNTVGTTTTDYKTPLGFTPVDGWTGNWTLQVNKATTINKVATTIYIPMPFNVTLSAIPNEVPVPAAAWLFGSGLLGLAGTARRRRSS